MKPKFLSILSLVLVFTLVLTLTSIALADPIVNDIDTTVDPTLEIRTITSGGSTSVGFFVRADTVTGDANGCNATGSNPATVNLSVPAGITASSTLLTFTGCGITQSVTFSSSTEGSYTIGVASVSGGKSGSSWDTAPASFTLKVNPPVIQNQSITVTNAAPTGAVYNASFGVAATASSGLPVAITTSGVCSGSGTDSATITMTSGTGICTVHYNQAGNSGYNAAPEKTSDTAAQKANATCAVSGYTDTYDANAHGAAGSCTGVGGVDLSAALNLGDTFTNVPGGTAHWTFTGGTNYNDQSSDVDIVITKADATCTVIDYTGTYDANAHGATGSCTSVKGEALDGLDLGASFTDVPGGTASWNFTDVTGNYKDASGSAVITIKKADATCSVNGYSGVYDTVAHGATGSCAGIGGESAGTLDLGASFTNVPGGTAHWTFTGNGNYNDQSDDVAVTLTKANATCTVSGYTGVYDTAAHGASGSCSGINGESAGTLNLGATFTNVPGGSAHWTFTGNSNYNDQNDAVAIVITQADANCSISGYSGLFDNAFHGASGSCSGINGESAGTLNLGNTFKYPDGGTAHWVFTSNGNYKDQSGDAVIKISAWTLSGFYQPVDMGNVWNTIKGGSTVPLKFNVYAGTTERKDVGTIESYGYKELTCAAMPGAVEDAIETLSATGGTSLRYDLTGGQFIFNWQTPKTATVKCYQVTVTMMDHSKLTAFFKTK